MADLGLFLGLRDCHGGCLFLGRWGRLVLGLDEDAGVEELHGIGLAGEVRGLPAAMDHFGAIWGQGVGLQGQSYAIPTMQGGPETIQPYVDEFIQFAQAHPELTFYVTKIGCGIAGFEIGVFNGNSLTPFGAYQKE